MVRHGAARLGAVVVDAYNAELRDEDGFLGDRASKRAFAAILDRWRERLRRIGGDPLGGAPTADFKKRDFDKLLLGGDAEAAGIVHRAVEEFAQELATVIRRFLRLESWRGTQRIAVGGGFRGARIGELAIGAASVLLKGEGNALDLVPIRSDPDEAGLLGCVHLVPPGSLDGHDGMLAADIGGTNIRAGIVRVAGEGARRLAEARTVAVEVWRHAEETPSRDEAVARLGGMLSQLAEHAEEKRLRLSPLVGIGCPGLIDEDGSIRRGGRNLPGNWESRHFNLPRQLGEIVPPITGQPPVIVMHNDAVVQGLSELPFMGDVAHWGILTIGTGLGNARFTNLPCR